MNDNSMNIFGKAMLYIFHARLENIGLKGDLNAVRTVDLDEPEQEAAG